MKKSAKLAFAMAGIVLLMLFSLAVWVGWFLGPAYPPSSTFMSTEKVCQRWGRHPLDTEKFKAAGRNDDRVVDGTVRAEMACSILENQDEYLGKNPTQIVDIFGNHHGYFVSDEIPAYFITDNDGTDQGDVWQIVFMLRRGKVSEVVVHNNCCLMLFLPSPETSY